MADQCALQCAVNIAEKPRPLRYAMTPDILPAAGWRGKHETTTEYMTSFRRLHGKSLPVAWRYLTERLGGKTKKTWGT